MCVCACVCLQCWALLLWTMHQPALIINQHFGNTQTLDSSQILLFLVTLTSRLVAHTMESTPFSVPPPRLPWPDGSLQDIRGIIFLFNSKLSSGSQLCRNRGQGLQVAFMPTTMCLGFLLEFAFTRPVLLHPLNAENFPTRASALVFSTWDTSPQMSVELLPQPSRSLLKHHCKRGPPWRSSPCAATAQTISPCLIHPGLFLPRVLSPAEIYACSCLFAYVSLC